MKIRIGDPGANLFEGQVTAVEYAYESRVGREIRIRAYDRLHRLRKRQPVRVHTGISVADLARDLVADLGLSIAAEEPGPVWPRLFQVRQSDLDLLVDVAERCGLFLFLNGDELELLSLKGNGNSVKLRLGDTMFSAKVELNGDSTCSSVMAAGWGSAKMESFRSLALEARLGRDVPAKVSPDEMGTNGERTLVDEAALDSGHVDGIAQAELDRRSAEEVTFHGVAEGNPELRPGIAIDVQGLPEDVAGRYVLTSVDHTIDRVSGYTSELSTSPPPRRTRPRATIAAPAIVTRVDDPEQLGRVCVSLPTYENLETDWIGVVSPGAGSGKGFITLPNTEDQVLVLLAHEDPGQAIVVGGMYGAKQPPDVGIESGAVKRFTLLTPGGQRIRLDDTRDTVRIENGKGSYIELTPEKMLLHSKVDLTIEAPEKAIVIQGQTIDFRRI